MRGTSVSLGQMTMIANACIRRERFLAHVTLRPVVKCVPLFVCVRSIKFPWEHWQIRYPLRDVQISWVRRRTTRRNLCRDKTIIWQRLIVRASHVISYAKYPMMLRCSWITIRFLQDAFQIGVDDKRNSFLLVAKTPPLIVVGSRMAKSFISRQSTLWASSLSFELK